MQILTIAGNVGKDAVLRNTQSGDDVLSFSIAVDNGKDANGNRRDSTWYDCSVWGKRARALEPYIRKGSKLTVSGRPTCRAHDGKAYLGLSVDQLTFQSSNGDNRSDSRPDDRQQDSGYGGGYGGPADMDDEIPFAPEWRI